MTEGAIEPNDSVLSCAVLLPGWRRREIRPAVIREAKRIKERPPRVERKPQVVRRDVVKRRIWGRSWPSGSRALGGVKDYRPASVDAVGTSTRLKFNIAAIGKVPAGDGRVAGRAQRPTPPAGRLCPLGDHAVTCAAS